MKRELPEVLLPPDLNFTPVHYHITWRFDLSGETSSDSYVTAINRAFASEFFETKKKLKRACKAHRIRFSAGTPAITELAEPCEIPVSGSPLMQADLDVQREKFIKFFPEKIRKDLETKSTAWWVNEHHDWLQHTLPGSSVPPFPETLSYDVAQIKQTPRPQVHAYERIVGQFQTPSTTCVLHVGPNITVQQVYWLPSSKKETKIHASHWSYARDAEKLLIQFPSLLEYGGELFIRFHFFLDTDSKNNGMYLMDPDQKPGGHKHHHGHHTHHHAPESHTKKGISSKKGGMGLKDLLYRKAPESTSSIFDRVDVLSQEDDVPVVLMSFESEAQEEPHYGGVLINHFSAEAEAAEKESKTRREEQEEEHECIGGKARRVTALHQRWVVGTQFEPTGARRCFPCHDVPSAKASFTVRVLVDRTIGTVVSNTHLRNMQVLTKGSGLQLYEFESTPAMSTYLLGLVVAPIGVYTQLRCLVDVPGPPFSALPSWYREHAKTAYEPASSDLTALFAKHGSARRSLLSVFAPSSASLELDPLAEFSTTTTTAKTDSSNCVCGCLETKGSMRATDSWTCFKDIKFTTGADAPGALPAAAPRCLLRVLVPSHLKHQGMWALMMMRAMVPEFHSFLGVPFCGTKLDAVMLWDLRPAAMENFGLMTFRQSELLHDISTWAESQAWFAKCWSENQFDGTMELVQGPSYYMSALRSSEYKTTLEENIEGKMRVTRTIAHEIAHQWFGNLATMKDWSQVAMNEAFATLLAAVVTDKLFPQWNVWAHFAAEEQSKALSSDWLNWDEALWNTCKESMHCQHHKAASLRTNRVVRPRAEMFEASEAVETVFDVITYAKGACLLRMVMHLIGETKFRQVLHYLLCVCAYGTFSFEQLFQVLGRECKACEHLRPAYLDQDNQPISLKRVLGDLEKWFDSPGFPTLELDYVWKSQKVQVRSSKVALFKELSWSVPLFLDATITTKETRRLPTKEIFMCGGGGDAAEVVFSFHCQDLEPHEKWVVNRESLCYGVFMPSAQCLQYFSGATLKCISSAERVMLLRGAYLAFRHQQLCFDDFLNFCKEFNECDDCYALMQVAKYTPDLIRMTRLVPKARTKLLLTLNALFTPKKRMQGTDLECLAERIKLKTRRVLAALHLVTNNSKPFALPVSPPAGVSEFLDEVKTPLQDLRERLLAAQAPPATSAIQAYSVRDVLLMLSMMLRKSGQTSLVEEKQDEGEQRCSQSSGVECMAHDFDPFLARTRPQREERYQAAEFAFPRLDIRYPEFSVQEQEERKRQRQVHEKSKRLAKQAEQMKDLVTSASFFVATREELPAFLDLLRHVPDTLMSQKTKKDIWEQVLSETDTVASLVKKENETQRRSQTPKSKEPTKQKQ